jgi:hypothetical protein
MTESFVSWLDFSETERRKMIEIVTLFNERDTRDELGLAIIRDGFADLFFPGTTTLQTRARYFLFVPWLYCDFELKRTASSKITSRLKNSEIQLIISLLASNNPSGVIGQRSGASLQRFPSSIYWIGLQRWGICRFHGTQDQYHRSLDYWYAHQYKILEADEKDTSNSFSPNWDPDIPEKQAGFPNSNVSFDLSFEEAKYLQDRLILSCTRSLLAYMVEFSEPVSDVIKFPWYHPMYEIFPSYLQSWLSHAQNFSEALHGAALLYNLMLAEKSKNELLVNTYEENMKNWRQNLLARRPAWLAWDRADFWSLAARPGVNVPYLSKCFVDAWLDLLFSTGRIARPEKEKSMRILIENRERRIKGGRSRFGNPRHLEMWSGASFTGQMEFRWGVGLQIINDILTGLGKGENNHVNS